MPALIVPIDVDALCVGEPDAAAQEKALGPTADFAVLPYLADGTPHNQGPYTSAEVLAGSAPFTGETPLVRGIHVHWALPAGLSHAIQGADGKQDFPAVPERWLVTRVIVDESVAGQPRVSTRSWVVESDRLSATPASAPGQPQPTVPMQPVPGQNFRYLGASFDLTGWQEASDRVERLTGLTAVGYGEPAFAGFYPNSSTSFGFLDTLADLAAYAPAASTVSYHVAGWYGNGTNDPLRGGAVPSGDNRYGWAWNGTVMPNTTVCSGAVAGIVWDPGKRYLAEEAARPLTVAVGDTGTEALSALMASVVPALSGARGDVERLLNALQFGLLSKTGQVDSLPAFEQALHDAGFAASRGGLVWSAVRTASTTAEGGEVPLPASLAHDLNTLNVLQVRADALTHRLRAMRQQLFADWYKYLLIRHQPQGVPQELRDQTGAVQAFLSEQAQAITAITEAGGTLEALNASIAAAARTINSELPATVSLRGDGTAPPYREPAEPVLLLRGPDVVPASRHRTASTDLRGGLACRLEDQVTTAVTLQAGVIGGSARITVPATTLPGLAALPPGAPAALLQALLRETILLAAPAQPVVTAACAAAGGPGNPARLSFAGTETALREGARMFMAGDRAPEVSYTGTAPGMTALHDWAGTPWLPLLLQYEVAFHPLEYIEPSDGGKYSPDFVNAGFVLAPDGVDLQYGGQAPLRGQLYSGSTLLGGGTAATMVDAIERFLNNTGSSDPALAGILEQVRALPLLAQQLTGVSQAMLMRELVLQLPVSDPLASPPQARFAAEIAAAVGPETNVGPMPEESFNPLRAGTLSVRRLRIVDAFGRFRDYQEPRVLLSAALRPPSPLSLPAGTAFLPPRLTQTARLLFRWLAASNDRVETNSHPATTPVFGWLVPNWLDRALAIYATDGTPLGQLALTIDDAQVLWTPAPGGPFPPGASIDTVFAGHNEHLRDFAVHCAGHPAFFAPFFAAIRKSLDFTLPAAFRESAEAAVLAGQPLALARAGLTLQVPGGVAATQSWSSFTARALHGAPPDDAGLSGIRFPVRLGGPRRLDDSLVGFWTGQDWTSFYSPAAVFSTGGVGPPAQDTVTLSPRPDGDSPTVVTLLLDPRGAVHATTGVLPVERITLPSEHYTLGSLSLALVTRPVLTASSTPAISLALPKTTSQHEAWTWVTVAGTRWQIAETADAPSAATLDYSPQQIAEGWLVLP